VAETGVGDGQPEAEYGGDRVWRQGQSVAAEAECNRECGG
jgi:hypothetical protein